MSGMTDALAQEIRRVDGDHKLGAAALAEALEPFITARLRGDGEQGKVVATVRHDTGLTITADRLPYYTGTRLPMGAKLYARPQPVAVAGDAVRLLPAAWRATIDAASPINRQDLRPIRFVQDLEAALTAALAGQQQGGES